ncbi:MAG: DUF4892 domain-containing protein [Cellvibrionaceae bacterium]|nr:DUF4892 domain-containing protein [Cellvibrionaceae bacterium]MCV6625197.1 DUF4892 domain-containing protein [Cellvibrionaceae bacterium]
MTRILPLLFLALIAPLSSANDALLLGQEASVKPQRVVYDRRQGDGRMQLPLGAIERIDGRWQPEQSRSLNGQLRRRTLEFAPAMSEAKIFQHYKGLAEKQGAKPIFSCQGRDCGRSNNWANAFFKIVQLYGREDSQRLTTLWLRRGNLEHYLVLYQVRRGNKRIYLQQDLLTLPTSAAQNRPLPSQSQLWQTWQRQGFLRLSEQQGSLNAESQLAPAWADLLAQLIRQRGRKLLLVSHHYGADAEQSAKALAAATLAQLEGLGVSQGLIETRALGDIAPLQQRPEGARIELFIR